MRDEDGKSKVRKAHKIVAEAIAGRALDPEDETVEHRCAMRRCQNPDHFTLLDRSSNTRSARGGKVVHKPLPSADPQDDNWEAKYVRTYQPDEPCPF